MDKYKPEDFAARNFLLNALLDIVDNDSRASRDALASGLDCCWFDTIEEFPEFLQKVLKELKKEENGEIRFLHMSKEEIKKLCDDIESVQMNAN